MYLILFLLAIAIYFILDYMRFHKSHYRIEAGEGYLITRFNKDLYGEFNIYTKLEKMRKEGKNLMFTHLSGKGKGKDNSGHYIVCVNETGVYVMTSKSMNGLVVGDIASPQWARITDNKKKIGFDNPVRANYGHVKELKSFIGDKELPFHSMVVFNQRCKLKKVEVGEKAISVIKINELPMVMEYLQETKESVMDKSDMDRILNHLKSK